MLQHYPTLFQSLPSPPPTSTINTTPNTNTNSNLDHIYKNEPNDKPPSELPPVLFLVGDQRRDIIPKTLMSPSLPPGQRIPVDELVVYETGVMASFAQDLDRALALCRHTPTNGSIDAETSSSPQELVTLNRATTPRSNLVILVIFSPSGCRETLRRIGVLDEQSGRAARPSLAPPGPTPVPTPPSDTTTTQPQSSADVPPPPSPPSTTTTNYLIATIGPTTRDYLRQQFGFEADVCAATPSPEGIGEGVRACLRGRGLLP